MRKLGSILAMLMTLAAHGSEDDPHAGHQAGGELKHGRYVGWLQLDGSPYRLALTADFYLESPDDPRKFPRLNAVFKMTLGGYNTHEYVTETFHDLRYDFDDGGLSFDEPQNDLVMTTEVHTMGSNTFIMGDVFVRSSAVRGKVYLKYHTDEPGADDEPGHDPHDHGNDEPGAALPPFQPLLQGQYEGTCDGKRAMIQLQTVRGLKTQWQDEGESGSLSRYYGITGRIAYADSPMCGTVPGLWCTHFNYAGGSYNMFLGKLTLHGPRASDGCELRNGRLRCRVRVQGSSFDCDFAKTVASREAKFFTARPLVRPTAEQKRELPPAAPPKSADLVKALRGTFSGFVHNETNDTYQAMTLHVTPFVSTINPHNPNEVFVSSTGTLRLGRAPGSPFVTQRYEPRSFYLRPGFTLSGPNTDSYLTVKEWKRGYLSGVLYSKAFGRVGTVQLVKGPLVEFPADVEVVRSFAGEFEGPAGSAKTVRWVRFLFPAQPNDLIDHLVRFTGSFQSVVGITATENIERGTFDPYTGALGWIISRGDAATFSNGFVDENDDVRLYWPPAPNVFGAYSGDFLPETFKRISR